ncbi:glutathione-dependent reductase [Planomonospora parontospora subsp. parontospora]|uniref:Glutathione-dependent reductase n=2 Tax=Planomonospora parontospora TaxID=58119 RepID=A0AA37F2I4_9ACTN|nr:glutathione S-transferase C-terminal domain-containing protein [Planomonospora parontospora]GGK49614.1 glutathione-dependent reductase [Planomonospora parontospora]GII07212.1 glutathione-dependent reductase [Planomonospora parontospora subsp. parontospora]
MKLERETSADGRFVRQPNRFTARIEEGGEHPPEPGRYQIYASYACPWAQRALIVRELLGLQDVVGVTIVDPIRDERGWRVPGGDPVTGAEFLSELYLASDPGYRGRHTVPCVWDRTAGRLVTNDYPQITLTLETAFAPWHAEGAPELYPEPLRGQIDALNDVVFHGLNNGVYKAGFATSQEAYDEAVTGVFATLGMLEERLSDGRPYLHGEALTESDVRTYTTLARFDAVYHSHFKCAIRRLVDHPALWAYARRLYAIPAFRDTTDFDHIKRHYYVTQTNINPTGIVPQGPDIDWTAP